MSKSSVEHLTASEVAEFSPINPAAVAREVGITEPIVVTEAAPMGFKMPKLPKLPKIGGQANRAPKQERGGKAKAGKGKKENNGSHGSETRSMRNARRVNETSERLSEKGYTAARVTGESFAGAGMATLLALNPFTAGVYEAVVSTALTALEWTTAGVATSVGLFYLASQIVPGLGGLTHWLAKKATKGLLGSWISYFAPVPYQRMMAYFENRKHKFDMYMYGLDKNGSMIGTGVKEVYFFYKFMNDAVSDFLDAKFSKSFKAVKSIFRFDSRENYLREQGEEAAKSLAVAFPAA